MAYKAAMGKKLGTLIYSRRKALGLTLQDIATQIGVSYPAVQQWEKGKTNPGVQNIPKLAASLGMDRKVLFEALQEEDPDVGQIIYGATEEERVEAKKKAEEAQFKYRDRLKLGSLFSDDEILKKIMISQDTGERSNALPADLSISGYLPVMGIVFAGSETDGEFYFNGSISDYVKRPAGLQYVKNAYCVYVVSDSMSPRFEPNDLLFVDPDRPAVANDFVVVELKGDQDGVAGPGFIKRLKRRGQDVVLLEQFNPPREFSIPADSIKGVHRVIPWREILGV